MSVIGIWLTACLLVLAGPATSQDHAPCPPAHCADPTYDPKTSCYSCKGSHCMLRGCVHNGAFSTTWMPDNCTVCRCEAKMEVCTTIECSPVECYGFPTITKPGKCCPECDFGVGPTQCRAVPKTTRSLYVSLGDNSCRQDVVEQECDKNIIYEDDGEYGAWFECEPVREEVTQPVADLPGCVDRISHVTYKTVTHCEKRRLSQEEIPLDYDPEPHSCYFYVDPQTVAGGLGISLEPPEPEPSRTSKPMKGHKRD